YRIYFNSGEINSEVKSIPDTLAKIKEKYNDGELNEIDGITLTYPDFWFNVRGSNTEPLIRLTLEAKTKDLMEKKRDEVLALIRE
ncbi:MAG TPA: phosphomannomutase/phosphoglucomutase, partial [Candidatus Woesebacteria bacterium]|nr:phosphomannomutase/phosphoglucomutase [Candidatus Woesebacteria bacterium]